MLYSRQHYKALRQFFWDEMGQRSPKHVMTGNAMGQVQQLSKPLELALAILFDAPLAWGRASFRAMTALDSCVWEPAVVCLPHARRCVCE